ncbi:MAG TPA: dUTP diphosphatase [Phototrophicaceae bacterium]|nr:dUTP diphosphatase [Phototrophicaceae bacterium]
MRVYLSEAFKELNIQFREPKPGDAGYDLYSVEHHAIRPGGRALIKTGIHVEVPEGYVGLMKDRSSMALAGLHTMGGVIDSSYRGELMVILLNTNEDIYHVQVGQKIAQMVVIPCYTQPIQAVASAEELSETERGSSGFGSTGQ